MPMQWAQWTLLGLFAAIGVIAAAVGLGRVIRREYLRSRGCRTTGTVVEIRQATDDASTVFAPVVAFPTEQGEAEVTGPYASPCFYRVGQQVPVCYADDDPRQAVILTRQEAVKAWSLLVAGLAFVGIGAALSLVI